MALRSFDYGTLATLGLAIVGGIFWLGNISNKVESIDVQEMGRVEGRVSALEANSIGSKDLGRIEGRVATLERDSISAQELGKLDGRLTGLENDKDFSSINEKKAGVIAEIQATERDALDKLSLYESRLIPKNSVLAWYGSGEYPQGWSVCDGSSGTPDLRGRVIVGVSDGFRFLSEGGSDKIASESHHSHKGKTGGTSDGAARRCDGDCRIPAASHLHSFNTGPGGAHDHGGSNLQPYRVLKYICKT